MKRLVLSVAVLAFLSVSCGPSVCDCISLSEKAMEAEDAEKFEEENKSTFDACEKMGEERQKELEGKSDEEKEEILKKWDEEAKSCK